MDQEKQIADMMKNSQEMVKNISRIGDSLKKKFSQIEIPTVKSIKKNATLLSNGIIKFSTFEEAKKVFDKIK